MVQCSFIHHISLITMIHKAITLITCLLLIALSSCRNLDAKEVKTQDDESELLAQEKKLKKKVKLNPLDSAKLSSVVRLYDLSEPDQSMTLSDELIEISGLSFNSDLNRLVVNNDENGTIYHLDLDGRILAEDNFGKDGDYEGIEMVGNDIVVSKSNGNLYFYDTNTAETLKVKTDLTDENDIEGLAYDQDNNLLLMACKGAKLKKKKSKHEKSIYAYNLKLEVLHEEPFLVMRDAVHLSYVEYHMGDVTQEEKEDLHKRVKSFAPSGLAINPINKDIYVLSARGSFIVAYDVDHDFQDILFFDEKMVPQPEGICFSPQGDLYVSTEGHEESAAKIFKYEIK